MNCKDPYSQTPTFDELKERIHNSEPIRSRFPGAQLTSKGYGEIVADSAIQIVINHRFWLRPALVCCQACQSQKVVKAGASKIPASAADQIHNGIQKDGRLLLKKNVLYIVPIILYTYIYCIVFKIAQ